MENAFQEVLEKFQLQLSSDSCVNKTFEIEPISFIHRPFSTIMKAQITSAKNSQNILIKKYNLKEDSREHLQMMQNRVKKDFEITRFLYDHFREYPGFSTSKILACFPELLTLVIEENSGQTLLNTLGEAKFYPNTQTLEKLSSIVYNCGRWLKLFQEITLSAEQFNLDEMIEYVDVRLKRLVANPKASFDQEIRERILRYFQSRRKFITDRDLSMAGIHADFCPGNILINKNEVVVIDFAMFHYGSTYHDLTHLYHQLNLLLMKPTFRPSIIAKLQKSLLKGYNENFDKDNNTMFTLFLIQHAVCHFSGLLKIDDNVPFHERWYNRRIMKRHATWLRKVCEKL